jgi:hypothetical protein
VNVGKKGKRKKRKGKIFMKKGQCEKTAIEKTAMGRNIQQVGNKGQEIGRNVQTAKYVDRYSKLLIDRGPESSAFS